MDYPLTAKQQSIIDKAVKLLLPYSNESVSTWTGYFEEQDEDGDCIGNHDFRDYGTCDNDDCLNHNHALLRAEYVDLNIQYRWYSNDGDHDKFEICSVCGRPLNEFLTWIGDEIDIHIEYSRTKENITDSRTAFEISGCFASMNWNADERMGSHYATYHYNDGIKRQRDFIKKIVKYANHVIKTIS